MSAQELQIWLVSRVAELTGINPQEISVLEPFTGFGLASKDMIMLSGELEELLGCRLTPTLLYDYPSIGKLARHLAERLPAERQDDDGPGWQSERIVLV